jgi:hypothetical protein
VEERVFVTADAHGVSRKKPRGGDAWSVPLRLFPALDPTLERAPDRRVVAGSGGTVLTGASDGSLVALDAQGAALYQLGVRGAVAAIEARRDGDFAVRTGAGLTVVIGPGGVVRREVPAWTEPVVADEQAADASAAAARAKQVPWKPTAAYRVRREGPEGKPFREVLSVLAAPSDVWVLAIAGEPVPGHDDAVRHLFHHDGRTWSDLGVPKVSFAKEVFAEGHPAEVGTFSALALGRSPSGAIQVIGVRTAEAKRMCVLERTAAGLKERRELFAIVAGIKTWRDVELDTTYAASAGGREILCSGSRSDKREDVTTCVEFGGGIAPRILPAAELRAMPDGADLFPGGRRGFLRPVAFAGDIPWRTNGWASSAGDVGGFHEATITRWNGTSFEEHESPIAAIQSAWASGRDDVWITGAEGLARFDGKRWWRITDVREGTAADLSVTGGGRGDVWLHGSSGLWHVTPDPDAQPDLEGLPASPPPAAAPSRALAVGGVDASYRLYRVTLPIDGGRPLRAALAVAEGPGGILWFHDGARLIEHDGARTRVLYQAPKPEPFVCWSAPEPDCEVCVACTQSRPEPLTCMRCAAPTAAGEGAVITEDGLLRIAGGLPAAPRPFSALLAVAASPAGAVWAVSSRADDALPHAVIQGPRGLRVVTGLPPAAYADVAPRADDDVWLAGGLATAIDGNRALPEGEGTLVHFDGHAFTRHRGPDGALLSVAAAAPGEAWAVGLGGSVLHAKAGAVDAFHLEGEGGAKLPVTLRGVAASRPDDVWMVGDGATLLHGDGKTLRRVDASAAGHGMALSAVIAPGARPGWVVGPTGIWRITPVR